MSGSAPTAPAPIRLARLARALGVLAALATVWCVATDEPARLLGLRLPGPVVVQALYAGTALAGPVPMVLACFLLGRAVRAGSDRAVRGFGVLCAAALVGMLGEEITYRVLTPGGFQLVPAAFVVLNLVVPAIALGVVLRASRWA